jgi:hypothetical protein
MISEWTPRGYRVTIERGPAGFKGYIDTRAPDGSIERDLAAWGIVRSGVVDALRSEVLRLFETGAIDEDTADALLRALD